MIKEIPLITVIIPTIGRPTLTRLLNSIPDSDDVGVIIIEDSYLNEFSDAVDVIKRKCENRPNIEWTSHDGGEHAWGHMQRNYGMSLAQGQWLMFSQDDNVFNADTFPFVIQILDQHRLQPVLFKVDTWQAGIVWRDAGRISEGNFDADCLVVPNIEEKLGIWANRYNGDADMIIETAQKWNNDLDWVDKIIAVARPESA